MGKLIPGNCWESHDTQSSWLLNVFIEPVNIVSSEMFNVKTESQAKHNAYVKYIKLCPQLAASQVTSHYSKVTNV